jgi:hypothetical protein
MDTLLRQMNGSHFDPEEVHELSVAYENVCAAIDGAAPTQEVRDYVAAEIVRMAKSGLRSSTDLYLRCLEHCRNSTNITIMKQVL